MNCATLGKRYHVLFALIFLSAALVGCGRMGDMTIAQVNLPTILEKSAKAKASTQDLEQTRIDSLSQLRKLASEVVAAENKLKGETSGVKTEGRDRLEYDLKAKREKLKSEDEAAKAQFQLKRKSTENSLNAQIRQAVEKIAKQEGIRLVISEQAVLYSESVPDITDKVIKALDADFGSEKPKAPASSAPPAGPVKR